MSRTEQSRTAGAPVLRGPPGRQGSGPARDPMDEGGRMRRPAYVAIALALVSGVLAAVTLAGGAAADDDDHGGHRLHANLKGENEVPGPGAPGGASGFARVEIKPGHGTVCFNLRWEEISPPTAAHIHAGTEAEAGPIV